MIDLGVPVIATDHGGARETILPGRSGLLVPPRDPEALGEALEHLLGLPEDRPDTVNAFRMLCRHNHHVQKFGAVRDLDEISRRERIWWDLVLALEDKHGTPAGALPPETFRSELAERLDLQSFEPLSS